MVEAGRYGGERVRRKKEGRRGRERESGDGERKEDAEVGRLTTKRVHGEARGRATRASSSSSSTT
jgi:hypothetical protein